MALTAVLIVTFAIINKQSFIKTLPTLVTLGVQIMVVRASRYAFLVGGTNALLYAIAPWSEGLYFSVISCVCISAPIQYMSFFIWNKKKSRRNSRNTELKFLGLGKCILAVAVTLAVWFPCYWLLRPFFSGALALLDSLTFVLGITISLLSAFRYIDSQYLNIFSCCLAILTWTIVCIESPNNLNYLVISFYNLFMVAKAAINWTKQYKNDKREKETVLNEN
jgi:nicotinamide mononucleotide transporter PnuC